MEELWLHIIFSINMNGPDGTHKKSVSKPQKLRKPIIAHHEQEAYYVPD
uniref:Uncharacterized protein n=1 Tax=Arundo donax TaxID=35708 RepID=A0A0A9DC10_ARUDO